jgi:ATP-binding cassette subfamily F protein uup
MALVEIKSLTVGFGHPPIIENISFQIEKGERIGLLGRNGTGKSTLIRVISGDMPPDDGEVLRPNTIRIASLSQEVPAGSDETIFDVAAQGMGPSGYLLSKYRKLSALIEQSPTPDLLNGQAELQHAIEASGGWDLIRQVNETLSRMNLDPNAIFSTLSAGMKRRSLFARAVASGPDVLLLDEPTNHLDIDAILWMEEYILRNVQTLLFVTHDRTFLKKIATRILELDRGRITSYACGYETFLHRRSAMLEAEENQNALFDKKLSQEEAWIRQGIKARRTRNEGRVRILKKMRDKARSRRKETGTVSFDLQEVRRSGKLVIEADAVSARYDGCPYIKDFSTTILRGDKVGIIGPNGAGKTTLLNILLKNAPPDSGSVRHGTHLQVAYFDQLRGQLDETKTVRDNIVEGNDFIVFNGEKRHVISYLRDFLFPPDRCRTPVHVLSGGEKNRLLLAKLFTQPSNVIVLDEPTNDLDTETLELLEDLLFNFQGTLLMVSHDRSFLNNVVTSTIVFEGNGLLTEYAGGFDDWLLQRPEPATKIPPEKKEKKPSSQPAPVTKPVKLGYMEEREFKALPQKIESLESRQKSLYDAMADPDFYKKDKVEISRIQSELETLEKDIETAYERWESLEAKTSQQGN